MKAKRAALRQTTEWRAYHRQVMVDHYGGSRAQRYVARATKLIPLSDDERAALEAERERRQEARRQASETRAALKRRLQRPPRTPKAPKPQRIKEARQRPAPPTPAPRAASAASPPRQLSDNERQAVALWLTRGA